MARPSEFDRDVVLQSAIKIFARHGFEAASTTDLVEGMGIGRQSLYGAFGDKRGLFLEALAQYLTNSLLEMKRALARGSPSKGVEAALLVGLGNSDDLESGCLGVGSIVEFSRSDPQVNALNDAAAKAIVEGFAVKVHEAIRAGEFSKDLDPKAVAHMLLALRSGLKVYARGGATRAELRNIANLALRGLRRV